MSKPKTFTSEFTRKIADLSRLALTNKEAENLSAQFNASLEVVNDLNKVDTKEVKEAYNITGLKNVFREDEIDEKRIFSQKEALSNAKRTHKGFFVVKGLFNDE